MQSTGVATGALTGWARVTVWSLGLIALSLVLFVVAIGEIIPPLVVFTVITLAVLGLCLKFGENKSWPWFVAAVGCVLLVVGNLPFLIEDLSHPETAFVFVPSVLAVVAAVLGTVGGLSTGLRKEPPIRPIVTGGAAIFIVATIMSVVAFVALESDAMQAGDTLIEVRHDYPETLAKSAGEISLFIDNKDRVRHTFVIDDLNVHQELPGITSRRVVFMAPAGQYRFYCDVPGHESMEGVLTVN